MLIVYTTVGAVHKPSTHVNDCKLNSETVVVYGSNYMSSLKDSPVDSSSVHLRKRCTGQDVLTYKIPTTNLQSMMLGFLVRKILLAKQTSFLQHLHFYSSKAVPLPQKEYNNMHSYFLSFVHHLHQCY
uniref:Uncharacterized protein n=1 Tax=Lygus hesperus TaxID=30085 RepID=A0A146LDD3_LYGHE